MAVNRGQVVDGHRYPFTLNLGPWSVIAIGSVPMPLMGAVPVTVVKEYVCMNIGHIVDVRLGYDDHWRRR